MNCILTEHRPVAGEGSAIAVHCHWWRGRRGMWSQVCVFALDVLLLSTGAVITSVISIRFKLEPHSGDCLQSPGEDEGSELFFRSWILKNGWTVRHLTEWKRCDWFKQTPLCVVIHCYGSTQPWWLSLQQRFPGIVESDAHAQWWTHTRQVCASLREVRRGGESAPAPTIKRFDFFFFVSWRRSKMFMSVWYAKKIGSRFLDNVRKTKKHRHRKMVGTIQACVLLFIYIFFKWSYLCIVFDCSCYDSLRLQSFDYDQSVVVWTLLGRKRLENEATYAACPLAWSKLHMLYLNAVHLLCGAHILTG